jgi:hypothetical protein
MAKTQMNAHDKMELLAYLEPILGCVESLPAGLGAVMADVAAIRNGVIDAPGELETHKSNLKLAVACDDLLEENTDAQR